MLKQYMTLTVVIICSFVFCGCRRTSVATLGGDARVASDIRKAELQKELDKKWENPTILYELGQLYHAEREWSKADWYYNNALNFNPAYRDVQAAIVKMQYDKGDKSKGEWAANSYMTQAGAASPDQLLALGVAFEKQGLDDFAIKCYQTALKTAPNSPTVNRQLGYYYLGKNQADLAKEYFIRSFQINPNQPDVAGELGRLGVAVKIPQAAAPAGNSGQSSVPAPAPK